LPTNPMPLLACVATLDSLLFEWLKHTGFYSDGRIDGIYPSSWVGSDTFVLDL